MKYLGKVNSRHWEEWRLFKREYQTQKENSQVYKGIIAYGKK